VGITANALADVLWAVVLIVLNGCFVAAEFAIVRSRRTRLEQFANQGRRSARHALDIVESIDVYLSVTQIAITLASLGLGWVAQRSVAPLLIALFGNFSGLSHIVWNVVAAVIAFLAVTFLQVVFGELAPKSLAIAWPETYVMNVALPLKLCRVILYPAIFLLNKTASGVLRAVGVNLAAAGEVAHSEEELRMLVTQSHESGVIDESERELFDNVFTFGDRVAREIMVPRTDMVCLFTDEPLSQCLDTVSQDRHTRFPLCEDDKDHVVGVIHSKDLFMHALRHGVDDALPMMKLARKVVTVPEALPIDEVLRMLQVARAGLAIVIDEYGGTAGMVTLEDVLEELVGEIQDEFDEERPPIEMLPDCVSLDARLLIQEVNEQFGLTLSDEEVDTIGGYVYSELTEALAPGLEVVVDGARFVVAEIDSRRITRVHLYLTNTGAPADAMVE